ncbi:hypothetical protein CT0861_05337, partial [Colletotrichum tofieldiae]
LGLGATAAHLFRQWAEELHSQAQKKAPSLGPVAWELRPARHLTYTLVRDDSITQQPWPFLTPSRTNTHLISVHPPVPSCQLCSQATFTPTTASKFSESTRVASALHCFDLPIIPIFCKSCRTLRNADTLALCRRLLRPPPCRRLRRPDLPSARPICKRQSPPLWHLLRPHHRLLLDPRHQPPPHPQPHAHRLHLRPRRGLRVPTGLPSQRPRIRLLRHRRQHHRLACRVGTLLVVPQAHARAQAPDQDIPGCSW